MVTEWIILPASCGNPVEPWARLFLFCTKQNIRHLGQRLHLPPGINRPSEGFHDRYPVEDYLDLFDQAAFQIQGNLTASVGGSPSQPNIIIGELTSSFVPDDIIITIIITHPGTKIVFIKHTLFYKNKAEHSGKSAKQHVMMGSDSYKGGNTKTIMTSRSFRCTNISCPAQSLSSCFISVMSEACCPPRQAEAQNCSEATSFTPTSDF